MISKAQSHELNTQLRACFMNTWNSSPEPLLLIRDISSRKSILTHENQKRFTFNTEVVEHSHVKEKFDSGKVLVSLRSCLAFYGSICWIQSCLSPEVNTRNSEISSLIRTPSLPSWLIGMTLISLGCVLQIWQTHGKKWRKGYWFSWNEIQKIWAWKPFKYNMLKV